MPTKRKQYALDQSPLYRLGNRGKLAKFLALTTRELRQLCRLHDGLYKEFPVAKKSGGTRDVENPHRKLKKAQAKIARLLSRIRPPDYLFCPVKGRCYVSNAARHRNQRVVHCLDIRKYYPNTPSRRVYWFFHRIMKCAPDIAATLTSLATYKGHLPTGSPLSPILAYFTFYDLWEHVAQLCKNYGYILTVYIDDVTISGENLSAAALWEVKRAIHRAGLRYHKENITSIGRLKLQESSLMEIG
jgi:retron-type reverse transcriptase